MSADGLVVEHALNIIEIFHDDFNMINTFDSIGSKKPKRVNFYDSMNGVEESSGSRPPWRLYPARVQEAG